jgi:hypothetical protein
LKYESLFFVKKLYFLVESSDEEFKGTRMYQENMDWIEGKLKEGYTVVDIGSSKGATKSVSYEGEKSKIREYLKNQKNEK